MEIHPFTTRKLNTISRAIGGLSPMLRIVRAILITAGIVGSAAGFVSYRAADGNGYDRGFENGEAIGFEDGRKERLATSEAMRQEGYNDGFQAGKRNGYNEGYDAATNEALRVLKDRLPPLLDLAFLAGKVSASSRSVPSFPALDFGPINFHCETEVNVFGDLETDCREGY